jgi:hypothetical protein
VQRQKFYQALFVTLTEKTIHVYKDRLTYEYDQGPSMVINLENVVKSQIFKFVPGLDTQRNQT